MPSNHSNAAAALRTLYRFMQPVPACNWSGEHSGPPALAVDMARPCGHTETLAAPTCAKHLNGLLKPAQAAPAAAPCPVCGATEPARLTAAHELHEPATLD